MLLLMHSSVSSSEVCISMYCSSACSCLHYIDIYLDVPCEGLVPESMFLFEKNSVCLNQHGTTGDVLCIYGEEICSVDF